MTVEMRQRVIQLVDCLPQESLPEAIAFLESLSTKANPSAVNVLSNSEELKLIKIIQYRLSVREQEHFDDLRERNEWGELTEAEHCKLIEYIEQIEDRDVERTEALMKLAKLRNVSLDSLLKEFCDRIALQ